MHSVSSAIGKQRLSEWVYTAERAGLKEFDACTKAVHNWSDEILNSFDCLYTNGFTEGWQTNLACQILIGEHYTDTSVPSYSLNVSRPSGWTKTLSITSSHSRSSKYSSG